MSYDHSGLLVTFEGQDGSGKSTMLDFLTNKISSLQIPVTTVAEFSDRTVGAFLQHQLKTNKFLRMSGAHQSALTETLYIIADLFSQDEFDIKPALLKGKIVLKERHIDSILACQIPKILEEYPYKREIDIERWLRHTYQPLQEPDLTIFLDVPETELVKRIQKRGEVVDKEDVQVFRTRQVIYERIAAQKLPRWIQIDNGQDLEQTANYITEVIEQKIVTKYQHTASKPI